MIRNLCLSFLAILYAQAALHAQLSERTVLVFPFENLSSERNLDWLGEGFHELITDRLHEERSLYVFLREERLATYERLAVPENAVLSRATMIRIGWETGADYVVSGTFETGSDLRVRVRITDLEGSRSLGEFELSGKLEDTVMLARDLGREIAVRILPGLQVRQDNFIGRPPVPASALENFVRGLITTEPSGRERLLQDAYRLYPQYYAAAFQIGRHLYLEKKFKESGSWMDRVVRNSAHWAYARFVAGLGYYELGEYNNAVAAFLALPKTYDVLVNLGASYAGRGDLSEALSTWRRAIELEPMATEAYFNLGYANLVNGDAPEAARYLDQAIRLHGRDAEAQFLLGRAFEKMGRDDARSLIEQALNQQPRLERWQGAEIPPRLGRLRAQPDVAALRATDADSRNADVLWTPQRMARWAKTQDLNTRLDAAQTLLDSELYGEAALELEDVVLGYPDSSDAYYYLGRVYEFQKEYDRAITAYQRSLQIRETTDTCLALARLFRTLSRLPQALETVQRALYIDPEHIAARAMKSELERLLAQRRVRQ